MGNIFTTVKPVTNLNSLLNDTIRIEYVQPNYFVTAEDELFETRAQIHVYGSNGEHYAGHLENDNVSMGSEEFEAVLIIVKIQPIEKIGMCGWKRVEQRYSYTFHLINGSVRKINVPLYRVF